MVVAPRQKSIGAARPLVTAMLVAVLSTAVVLVGAPPGAAVEEVAAPLASAVGAPDFRPVTPARLADTRPGRATVDGSFRGGGYVKPASPLRLTVTGRGGVPASGVAAVTLNVTVTGPTAPGYLTAYPSGRGRPNASNLNFERGLTVANAVTVSPGADGRVVLYTSASAHVIVDVTGYFTAGGIEPLTPARLADSRAGRATVDGKHAGSGPLSAGRRDVQVTGRGGVPAHATAVALNVTVTGSATDGYLTVYPAGAARPTASNLNFVRGQTVANSVVAKVGTGGRISIYGSAQRSHVLVDVAGYFTAGSDFVPMTPARFADTRANRSTVAGPVYYPPRTSRGTGPIGGGSPNGPQLDVLVSGRGPVPLTDTGAVVLNVTVTSPSASGHLTVFPLDTPPPSTSSLNFGAGQTVANMVVMPLGRGGGISIRSSVPRAHVLVDVLGWFPGWSTADQPGVWSSIARDVLGMPMTYDRCYQIPFKINPGSRPEWVADTRAAIGVLEAATGIDFVDLGISNEVPSEARFDADHLLIAFTTPAVIGDLGDGVLGIGGSVYGGLAHPVRWIPEQFWHGFAYIDAGAPMATGFEEGLSFGQVVLHELAHVVGLGHVDNVDEIMNHSTIFRAGHFGPGDLYGLSLLYRTQGCPGSPATFGAVRASAGKPMPDGVDPEVVISTVRRP